MNLKNIVAEQLKIRQSEKREKHATESEECDASAPAPTTS